MPCRLLRSLFKSVCDIPWWGWVVGLLLIVPAGGGWAYPDKERKPGSGSLTEPPLKLVSSQAEAFVLSPDDRFLIAGFGASVKVIDTETWGLYGTQVPALSSSSASQTDADIDGNAKGLDLRSSTQVWVSQDDGDLLRFDSSDFATLVSKSKLGTKALGPLVADTESGSDDDKIYVTSPAGDSLFVYDVSDQKATELPLKNATNQAVTPTDLTFVAFPMTASTQATDKIFVATDEGILLVLAEGQSTTSIIDIDSVNRDNLSDLALSPERNLLFVLDATDSAVYIVDTVSGSLIDADGNSGNGTTPITFVTSATPPTVTNSSLTDLVVTTVNNPSDTYLYVAGANGISVADLNISATTFSSYTLLDLGTTGTTNEPLPMSSAPGSLVATSSTFGNIYTSNSNAQVSILSDNPFVTASTDLSGSLGPSGSFNVTLQADETGTFSMRAGGGRTASGTLLTFSSGGSDATSGTLGTADSNQTVAVSYASNASGFSEGTNRILVFVTDSVGRSGWDAFDIAVDTPPPAVTIVGEAFGNQKAAVTFERLTQVDIAQYNIYAGSSAAVAQTIVAASATVLQPSSGERVTGTVTGLTNGTPIFLAVEAQDKAGNKSATRGVSGGITPEETVGLVGILAEGGCSLIRR